MKPNRPFFPMALFLVLTALGLGYNTYRRQQSIADALPTRELLESTARASAERLAKTRDERLQKALGTIAAKDKEKLDTMVSAMDEQILWRNVHAGLGALALLGCLACLWLGARQQRAMAQEPMAPLAPKTPKKKSADKAGKRKDAAMQHANEPDEPADVNKPDERQDAIQSDPDEPDERG